MFLSDVDVTFYVITKFPRPPQYFYFENHTVDGRAENHRIMKLLLPAKFSEIRFVVTFG